MAKSGMRRYLPHEDARREQPDNNEITPVPELGGKAKTGKKKAKPK